MVETLTGQQSLTQTEPSEASPAVAMGSLCSCPVPTGHKRGPGEHQAPVVKYHVPTRTPDQRSLGHQQGYIPSGTRNALCGMNNENGYVNDTGHQAVYLEGNNQYSEIEYDLVEGCAGKPKGKFITVIHIPKEDEGLSVSGESTPCPQTEGGGGRSRTYSMSSESGISFPSRSFSTTSAPPQSGYASTPTLSSMDFSQSYLQHSDLGASTPLSGSRRLFFVGTPGPSRGGSVINDDGCGAQSTGCYDNRGFSAGDQRCDLLRSQPVAVPEHPRLVDSSVQVDMMQETSDTPQYCDKSVQVDFAVCEEDPVELTVHSSTGGSSSSSPESTIQIRVPSSHHGGDMFPGGLLPPASSQEMRIRVFLYTPEGCMHRLEGMVTPQPLTLDNINHDSSFRPDMPSSGPPISSGPSLSFSSGSSGPPSNNSNAHDRPSSESSAESVDYALREDTPPPDSNFSFDHSSSSVQESANHGLTTPSSL